MKNIKNFIMLLIIYLFLTSCKSKNYVKTLPKSKVTLELYTNQGNKIIRSFIIPNQDIYTLECKPNNGIFHKGYYDLYYFDTHNSRSGSTLLLQSNVASFNIIKIENDIR